MKALFVCDNDENFENFEHLFKGHFPKHELVRSKNSSEAFDLIATGGPFHFFIIDVMLKEEEPLEVIKDLIELGGEKPIIYIGTEDLIKKRITEEIIPDIEMEKSIIMPFNPNQLKTIILWAIKWVNKDLSEDSVVEFKEEDCLPVKIKNFYLFDEVPYTVYFRVTKRKYTPVITANKPYSHSIIQKYQKRMVRFFYLLKEDHIKFLEQAIDEGILALSKIHGDKLEDALRVQINCASVIQQYLRIIGISDSIVALINDLIQSCSKTYDMTLDIKQILKSIPFNGDELADQSILKFYISETILREMGWRSGMARKKLGLVSLIHDCTLSNDEMAKILSLNDPNLKMFNAVEQNEYIEHPLHAASLAEHFTDIHETEFVIRQHHEMPDGSGFPSGFNSHKVTSLSAVFIIASNFVTEIAINGLSTKTIQMVAEKFQEQYNSGNFKQPLSKLLLAFSKK